MRLRPFLLVALLARFAAAQASDTTQRAPGLTVSGIVHDSVARLPLAGATVQLVPADGSARFGRTAVSDSLGRFALADVPEGQYLLGFFHPMLDSLGLEPPLRAVQVEGRRPVRADLAIPAPSRIRAAICGPAAAESGAMVMGIVRNAGDGGAAAGVTVTGVWLELTFTSAGLVQRVPRLVATTGDNGWFAMCNVPGAGTMSLSASRGADSTDLIEVEVPADGFLRRELYLGPTRTVVTGDTMPSTDSLAPRPRRVHVGDGRLSGTVVAAAGGRPLVGARVSITDGPQTRANDRGEWTLTDAPAGSRMLEINAVGFYPVRRAVDVIAGAPPIKVALSTLEAVLDTVRVTAARNSDRHHSGFNERRRTGMGRYLTPEDVARWQPIVTSSLFQMMPGLRLERSFGDTRISMRGMFGQCSPFVYVDGHYMGTLTADDIDGWVHPDEIAGIEVYTGGIVPPQFQRGLGGCGSIVIWTRVRPGPPPQGSLKSRLAKALGVTAVGLAMGALFAR